MNLTAIFGMTDEAQRRRTEAVTRAVHDEWDAQAPNENYREGLTSEVVDDYHGRVTLGFPGVFQERGAAPRNISEALLRSPKAKVSTKTGARYMSIKIDGEFRTTSSARPPWMTKGKPGAGLIPRIVAILPRLLTDTRGAR